MGGGGELGSIALTFGIMGNISKILEHIGVMLKTAKTIIFIRVWIINQRFPFIPISIIPIYDVHRNLKMHIVFSNHERILINLNFIFLLIYFKRHFFFKNVCRVRILHRFRSRTPIWIEQDLTHFFVLLCIMFKRYHFMFRLCWNCKITIKVKLMTVFYPLYCNSYKPKRSLTKG